MADDSPSKSSGAAGKLLQLPLARIKMIMRSSPDLGNVSTEGYFLIAKAAVGTSLPRVLSMIDQKVFLGVDFKR